MINADLEARLADLHQKCEREAVVTCTQFLTPAEQAEGLIYCRKNGILNVCFSGGNAVSERKIAFFLPYYESPESFDPAESITAFKAETRFANLTHRDYLGALLALGIKRSCIGDIYPQKDGCYFYAVPVMKQYIEDNFSKAGRAGIRLSTVALSAVECPEGEREIREFTVKSLRLDAVAAGMFALSRTETAREIEQGLVFLNHTECLKADAEIKLGDTVSIRGKGKGKIAKCDGYSRKGRIFVTSEIFV